MSYDRNIYADMGLDKLEKEIEGFSAEKKLQIALRIADRELKDVDDDFSNLDRLAEEALFAMARMRRKLDYQRWREIENA